MTTLTRADPAQPWYREFWPWFLMAGPALVVVASMITYVLAARTENALVADNYYKEGLAINRVLDAARNAATHHYHARLVLTPGEGAQLALTGDGKLPSRLRLMFIHPTHGRLDQTIMLEAAGQGEYRLHAAGFNALAGLQDSPRWYVRVQDEAGAWRLAGQWDRRRASSVEMSSESH